MKKCEKPSVIHFMMVMLVSLVVTLCILVGRYQCFGEAFMSTYMLTGCCDPKDQHIYVFTTLKTSYLTILTTA